MLTQAELKSQLSYDPETGIFTRLTYLSLMKNKDFHAGYQDLNGYIIIRVFGTQYKAHRLAWLYMTGEWPKDFIDHINGTTNDNRFTNIRRATRTENIRNRARNKNNKSGYKGVGRHNGKWRARIRLDSKELFLGYYKKPEDAHKAYCAAADKYHGEFANYGNKR